MKSKFTVLATYSNGRKYLSYAPDESMNFGEAEDELPKLKEHYEKLVSQGHASETPTLQIISIDEAGDYK